MGLFKDISREKINFYSACLLVFSLPFYRWISTYFIAIWVITWIIEGNFKSKFNENKKNYLLYIPIVFYLVYAVSVIYSTDKAEAYFDIEVKLSFLIFPIVILTSNKLYKKKFIVLLKVFVLANFIASLACLIHSFILSISIKNGVFYFNHDLIGLGYSTTKLFMIGGTKFMYTALSMFLHPGYFSLYIIFSISVILFILIKKEKSLKFKIIWLVLLIYFSVFNYLLFSRAGIINFIIILIIYFISSIFYSKSTFLKILKSSILLIILSISVFFISLNERMQIAVNEIGKFKLDEKYIKGNNEDRIPMWYVTGLIIKDNYIIGVGTGDVKAELKMKYLKFNLDYAYTHDLNVHNQFLETFMGVGLLGILLLLVMMFLPIIIGIKQHDFLCCSFFITSSILMMVESAFNGQSGVVFFMFFYCLIIINLKQKSTF